MSRSNDTKHVAAILLEISYGIKPLSSGESYQNTKAKTVQNSQRAGLIGSKRGTKSSPGDSLVKLALHSSIRSARRLWQISGRLAVDIRLRISLI